MNAVRMRARVESETLTLTSPDLRPMIGREVEVIVLEEARPADPVQPVPATSESTPYDALFELAGQGVVDPEAFRRQREHDRRSAT
jgi:hypothetical protein